MPDINFRAQVLIFAVTLSVDSFTQTTSVGTTTPTAKSSNGTSELLFIHQAAIGVLIGLFSFMGSNAFCFKACDPSGSRAAALCQHIYDRIGCAFNAPSAAKDGVFEACEGEPQDPPGIYTGADGQTSTYTQPAEGIEPSPSDTYTPRIPASSNCVTFQSSEIYTALPTPSGGASPSGSASGSGASTTSGSGSSTRSPSGSAPSGTPSGSGSGDGQDGGDGAMTIAAMWSISVLSIVATAVLLA